MLTDVWRQALATGTIIVVLAGPAAARPTEPPVVDDPTGTVTTVIHLPGSPGNAPGAPTHSARGASLNPCTYRYDPSGIVAEIFDFSRPDAPTQEQIGSGAVRWFSVSCPGQADYTVFTLVGQPPPGPPPPTPAELAADARRVLQLPTPVVRHNPPDSGLTNLTTWLWLDDSSWQVQTSTLSLRGTSVTVVARPVRVDWRTGDGVTVTCAGQGRSYDPHVPATQQDTYCSHTYHRSSAGQPGNVYSGSATSFWQIRWTGSAPGGAVDQGELPALELTTAFRFPVQEVQDLVTRAG